jgi:single-strand selective monofunctional uracil DNA glycosylase
VSALVDISERLAKRSSALRFASPIAFTYNPLEYAWRSHVAYLKRYGGSPKEVLLLGMNPGPFGMAQTGVPFGDVAMVRDWLGIDEKVDKPRAEHPKRPIDGFACKRREVSGSRLWGWARDRFGKPEHFFARFFVVNYCPLCFMEDSGKNFTPDKLPRSERAKLFAVCDQALSNVIDVLEPKLVVGVGAFAEGRARSVVESSNHREITVGTILHPSPASPKANKGWAQAIERELMELGVQLDAT